MSEEQGIQPAPDPKVQLPSIDSTPDDRTMAMLCHLLGGFGGFIVPLIIWLIKKDQSRFVDDQGKEALNFHLTMLIGHVVAGVTICFTAGMLNMAVYVLSIVFSIIGAMESNKGVAYRYPICIRFIS
jgi:uncharacterized Tic20 family protein